MILPTITERQKEIINFLYTFRFLHTNQFQKLFNHKDKTMIKEWLKDLREKKYIVKIASVEDSFRQRTKPFIYCLATKSRRILKASGLYDTKILDRIYKERKRDPKFIKNCLAIADMYLYFLSQKDPNQVLEYFTKHELNCYDFFPENLSAYITLSSDDETKRYFLTVFDSYLPPFVLRNRVKNYIAYAESDYWETNSNGEPFPAILFVCPTENLKSHIYFYTKYLLKKACEKKIDLYLTTWDLVKRGKKDLWEKVPIFPEVS